MTPQEYKNRIYGRNKSSISPETKAYVEWSRQKRVEDENRKTPLEWATNLLSAGSNMTANTAENIMRSFRGENVPFSEYVGDVLKSFTPEGEKSWQEVMWGKENTDYQGMFGSGGTSGGKNGFASKAFRFATGALGDILLDPSNYISFGATGAAKAAASADAELKMIGRALNPVDVNIVTDTIDKKVLQKLFDGGKTKEAFEYASKFAKEGSFQKEFNRYYKEALRMNADEMKRDFLSLLGGKTYNPQQELVNARTAAWLDNYDSVLAKRIEELSKAPYLPKNTKKLITPEAASVEKTRQGLLEVTRAKRDFIKANRDKILDEASNIVRSTLKNGSYTSDITDLVASKGIFDSVKDANIRKILGDKGGLLDSLKDSDVWGKINLKEWENPFVNLDHAGESSMKLFRKELNAGAHEGFNNAMKQWDAFKETLWNKKNPLSSKGATYSDAWWSLMNNSTVGRVRRVFGFENPYETMLKIKERDASEAMESSIQNSVKEIQSRLSSFSDDDKLDYVLVKSLKEKIGQNPKYATMSFKDFARANADKIASQTGMKVKVDEETLDALAKIDEQVGDIFSTLKRSEDVWSKMGFGKETTSLPDYLTFVSNSPNPRQVGPGTVRGAYEQVFQKRKTKGLFTSIKENSSALRDVSGLTDDQIAELIADNAIPVNTNLDEIIASRVMQHYKFKKRVDIIEAFRPFGINVESADSLFERAKGPGFVYESDAVKAANAMNRKALFTEAYLDKLGLQDVADESLAGYRFDPSVAAIIDRTTKLASNDPDIQELQKVFSGFTHLWKTTVTSTPGFHIRNFYSNMATLFQQHGLAAIDGEAAKDSMVATMVGLNGVDEAAKRLNMAPEAIRLTLQHKYGDSTLGELVNYARSKGIISMSYGGRDSKEAIADLLGKAGKDDGIVRKGFEKVGQVSRGAGAHIESFAKMDSLLIGVKRLAGDGEVTPAMLEYAKNEAKKWFIDYDSLTEFERNTMKKVFPFYTWLRRNVANQVGQVMAIENWPTMALPQKILNNLRDKSVDTSQMPMYQRDEGGIPISRNDDDEIIYLYPQLPINDLNKLPIRGGATASEALGNSMKSLFNTLIDSAHPFLKAGLSMADYATKRDGDREKKETSGFIEDKALTITDTFMRLLGDPIAERGENGRIMVDSDVLETVRALAPQIRTLDRLFSLPKSATMAMRIDTDELMNEVASKETSAEKVKTFWNMLSFWAGIRGNTVNEQDERYKRAQGIYYNGLEEKNKAEKKSAGYQTRSLKNRRSMERTYRRIGLL